MDISKARMVFELIKDNKKVLVTLWDEDKISSCIEEAEIQRCEACQGNEELCREYIKHLVDGGYEAKEIRLGELELEESLPKFLEGREVSVKAHPVIETEENVHADIEAAETVLGSPGELQPGESGGSSPETS